MSEATAPCPICNKLVSLEAINNHIDICLLPGGRELHADLLTSKSDEENSAAPTLSTAQSQQPIESALTQKKKRSLSPNPSGSKQSFLSFGQTERHQTSTPPPAKSRKFNWTSSSSSAVAKRSNRDDDEETTTSHHDTVAKTDCGDKLSVPLAEAMRPSMIENYVGQENVMGKNKILRTILESGDVPSLIFWGPPGCGKVKVVLSHLAIDIAIRV